MLKSYLTIALRSLRKQAGYTLINVVGLAVGLACFFMIGLFVRFELSYDAFHEKADRIYRVVKEDPGAHYLGANQFAVTPAPMAQTFMDEFPEVEHAVQLDPVQVLLGREDDPSYEDGLFATQHFFDVFSFELLQGDPRTALAEPNSVVLTSSLAQKHFGEANPLGASLPYVRGADEGALTVTGIVVDPPPNSHVAFDYLLSMATSSSYRRRLETGLWDDSNYYTYVTLRPGSDLPTFEENLVALANQHLGQIAYYRANPDRISVYFPQALTDIHLQSHLNFEIGPNGDIKYVVLFSAIGLLILLIACINYVNLATAQSVRRAKEVGVRKAMGAQRRQLVGQFMGEAMILSVVAVGLAVVLVQGLLPVYNTLTAREMSLGSADQPSLWLLVVGIGLGIGLLSGSYPAFVLSRIKPIGVLKGRPQRRADKPTLRNVLVVTQFAITVALIVSSLAIKQQLHYVQTSNTGVDRDHIVSIQVEDRAARGQYAALKEALAQHPNVRGVTASWSNPTRIESQAGTSSWEGAEEGQRLSVYHTAVQHGFVDLFGIELVDGRDFSEARETAEREGMLINETMAQQLGWETAVGKRVDFQGRERHIIGVMKDFNFLSFHQAIAPLALYLGDEGQFSQVFVKVRPEQTQATLAHLKATMAGVSPAYPFEYTFLDDAYNQMYRTEVQLGCLLSSFTGLALLIACLGLFGLGAFTASQRTKEIGIRKVLGAGVPAILALLSKEIVKLVGIAFLLAVPVAYAIVSRWLDGFAYRIALRPDVFLFAGGFALVVALATVSYHALRATSTDPVKALRYE